MKTEIRFIRVIRGYFFSYLGVGSPGLAMRIQ